MKVFIANLGVGNYLWQSCRDSSCIAIHEDEDTWPLLQAGDRDAYIAHCIATKKTAAGITPTRPVASRWFNLRTVKNKELRFRTTQELEKYIDDLIESQEGLCALTGLPLQYYGDHDDLQLVCSLDRIDSDGHYEAGNLQVVCRFANRWKSNQNDAEFRRLISLVIKAGGFD